MTHSYTDAMTSIWINIIARIPVQNRLGRTRWSGRWVPVYRKEHGNRTAEEHWGGVFPRDKFFLIFE